MFHCLLNVINNCNYIKFYKEIIIIDIIINKLNYLSNLI